MTGEPVEGIEGAIWIEAGRPQLDGQGNILYLAAYLIDDEIQVGYFYGVPGQLQLLLETGQIAPGYDDPSKVIAWLGQGNLAEDGTMSLWVEVEGLQGDWIPHIYSGTPNQLFLALSDGGPAPDSPEGATMGTINSPKINADGLLATWGFIHDYGTPGTIVDVVMAGDPDELRLVAYGTGPAPDIEGGATFQLGEVPSVGGLAFNDLGWAAFSAWFEGPLVDETNGLGLFAGTADDLRLVARLSYPAPGMEDGVLFTNFLWEQIHLDANGNAPFVGFVDGPGIDEINDIGVWYGPREHLQFVDTLR